MTERNERNDLPSASGALRRKLCPGSFALERLIEGNQGRSAADDAMAQEGEDLHLYMEGVKPLDQADDDDQILINIAKKREEEILGIAAQYGITGESEEAENRLWLRDGNGKEMLSGRFDKRYSSPDGYASLIIDYKFGWDGAGEASDNDQLMDLAVLDRHNFGTGCVIVALIQPRLPQDAQLTYAKYESEDSWKIAHMEVYESLKRTFDVRAKRVAGPDQCRWCRAKGICPESRKITTAIELANQSLIGASADKIKQSMLAMPITKREMEVYKLIESMAKVRRDQAKEIILGGGTIDGLSLAKPRKRKIIEGSTKEVVRALVAASSPIDLQRNLVELNELAEIADIKVTAMIEHVRKKWSIPKHQAEKAVRAALGPLLIEKEDSPSIEFVK